MAGRSLDEETIQELMWQDDEKFEETVSTLTMRGLLDLVSALQNAMTGEQRRFDQLSIRLQMCQDSESAEHRQISASLCTSQLRLARLCTRNMRCFTQQAIRAKQEPPRSEMNSIELQDEPAQNFQNSLKFFQRQVKENENSVNQSNVNTILEKVKLIRPTQFNGKYEEDADFIVHKTAYSEPDIPSPDYNSSEEDDYQVHRTADSDEYDDNSYGSDPRRYVYYPEEKELEVIPEEDEEIEEDHEVERPINGRSLPDGMDDESTKTALSQTECDSGVTDDQRSSAAEECDLDEDECDKCSLGDTDSAKGSLLPDSIDSFSESLTYSEKQLFHSSTVNVTLQPSMVLANSSPDTERYRFMPENLTYSVNGSIAQSILLDSKNMTDVQKTIGENQIEHSEVELVETEENASDVRRARSTTSSWDPTELIKTLYSMEFIQTLPNTSAIYINIEGFLEKLPSGRRKATYWNPWKRKYFQAKDGYLFCFENSQCDKAIMKLHLMGGSIDSLENNMIGIDDKKGHYVVVKCSSRENAEKWKTALISQCTEDTSLTYVHPVQFPLRSHKNVVIIDLGSCSIRAGILMDQPSLPQIFFPTVCSTDKNSGTELFGLDALLPSVRQTSILSFPVLPSAKITKYTFDVDKLPGLLKKVFSELNINPADYKVQVCVPRSFSLQTQIIVVKTLLEDFGVEAINLTHQAILSLYAYSATSGIVVDIGDRLDILPIIDGYIVESGVTRLPYGGQRIQHHLRHNLAQKHFSLVSDIESFLGRYILEQSCYIATNYEEEMQRFIDDPESVEKEITVKEFFQGEYPWEKVILDYGRFQAPEGLFTPDLWGLDNPGIQKLVHLAIKECSMDIRREMARSIYLSGGVSLLPGFAERLQNEVDKLTPPSVTPKVHASPYRYHMAYLGACQLANSDDYRQVCVTLDEWKTLGNSCLKKWHI